MELAQKQTRHVDGLVDFRLHSPFRTGVNFGVGLIVAPVVVAGLVFAFSLFLSILVRGI